MKHLSGFFFCEYDADARSWYSQLLSLFVLLLWLQNQLQTDELAAIDRAVTIATRCAHSHITPAQTHAAVK